MQFNSDGSLLKEQTIEHSSREYGGSSHLLIEAIKDQSQSELLLLQTLPNIHHANEHLQCFPCYFISLQLLCMIRECCDVLKNALGHEFCITRPILILSITLYGKYLFAISKVLTEIAMGVFAFGEFFWML